MYARWKEWKIKKDKKSLPCPKHVKTVDEKKSKKKKVQTSSSQRKIGGVSVERRFYLLKVDRSVILEHNHLVFTFTLSLFHKSKLFA